MNDLLKYQIGITLIKGIGPNLAKNLIAYLGGVEAVFKEKKQNLAKIPGIGDVRWCRSVPCRFVPVSGRRSIR